ncbi:MAG: MotA/TolQ/ExbB proton channel family protein [Planctomycetes bacterium]|nr:MotA/TolQ/ExbB proton channel family protein [Planctomycetota bacterium]
MNNPLHGLSLRGLLNAAAPVIAPLLLASTALAQTATTTERPSAVIEAFQNAGVIGWVIVVLSVISVALIIENFVSIKRDKLAPPELIDELEALFDDEQYQDAAELCESERTYFTNIVHAGLLKLEHSFETVQSAVREMEDEETLKLFQKIGWLSLITASAPMLGLLGTVTGMFITFGEIAAAGGSVSPAQLAGGIKLALVTTIFGLIVALPTGAFYFTFRNKVLRTSIEVNAIAEELFERFRNRKAA